MEPRCFIYRCSIHENRHNRSSYCMRASVAPEMHASICGGFSIKTRKCGPHTLNVNGAHTCGELRQDYDWASPSLYRRTRNWRTHLAWIALCYLMQLIAKNMRSSLVFKNLLNSYFPQDKAVSETMQMKKKEQRRRRKSREEGKRHEAGLPMSALDMEVIVLDIREIKSKNFEDFSEKILYLIFLYLCLEGKHLYIATYTKLIIK